MKRGGIWINERDFVSFSDPLSGPTSILAGELATRKTSLDFYSIAMYLPDPDPVLRKQGKDQRIYRELLADAHVWSCVTSRRSGVKSLLWAVDRGKAPSRQAKIIKSVFDGLNLYGLITQILDATLFGFSPLEIIWAKNDGLVLPARIVGKPPEWFAFNNGNELVFKSRQNPLGETLPPRKFLCPKNDATYQNPYGERALSRVFWPVAFKKGGLRFWTVFMEKFGMPYLIGKVPRGAPKEEVNNLADTLEAMVQDAIAVIPDDSSVDIKEAGGKAASGGIYQQMVQEMNAEISKAILGQTLTTEIGNKGSYAASNTHFMVRQDIVDSDKKLVENTMNRLIALICELNFADGERPVFSMWKEEAIDLSLATRDKTLAEAGVRLTKTYYQSAYGFGDDEIESVGAPGAAPAGPQFSERPRPMGEGVKYMAPDQQAIDDAVAGMDPQELQRQMEGVLKPVIDLVNKEKDYNTVLDRLAEAYPDMDTSAIEEMLSRAIFVSELWGRLSASE